MAENVNIASQKVSVLSDNVNDIISNNINTLPIIINNFNKTMIDISEASNSLKNLLDYLERHPESILKGKGR